jgi:NADH:flavin oxidoreductases, Old Yellow Enzyme family
MRLPVEVVSRVREAVGKDFILVFRISLLDLVPDGSSWEEVVALAKAIERAGATILNTGIGWHEARVPTIATSVPRAAFAWVTRKLKGEVGIPLCTTNRINAPEVAEEILASGDADMVSMARPLLADPDLVRKAAEGRADEINTCIACNQACLDHVFAGRRSPASSTRAPAARPSSSSRGRGAQARGRRRRRPGGPRLRDGARRARARRRPLRGGGGDRRAVQPGEAGPGKEEFAETLATSRGGSRRRA